MRSGIAGRADTGTQALQFNATPTPATALHAIPDHGPPRPLHQPGLQLARGSRGHCCRDDPHALRARWGCQHLGASLANECQAHPSERQPQRARQPVGIAEQWTKTGQMHTRGASARKPQARTRQRARHAMRSGIAGRANTGTQARQFNATPTPATALRAIHDNGAPRPARQPGLQLASSGSGHCGRDASHDGGRPGDGGRKRVFAGRRRVSPGRKTGHR